MFPPPRSASTLCVHLVCHSFPWVLSLGSVTDLTFLPSFINFYRWGLWIPPYFPSVSLWGKSRPFSFSQSGSMILANNCFWGTQHGQREVSTLDSVEQLCPLWKKILLPGASRPLSQQSPELWLFLHRRKEHAVSDKRMALLPSPKDYHTDPPDFSCLKPHMPPIDHKSNQSNQIKSN